MQGKMLRYRSVQERCKCAFESDQSQDLAAHWALGDVFIGSDAGSRAAAAFSGCQNLLHSTAMW